MKYIFLVSLVFLVGCFSSSNNSLRDRTDNFELRQLVKSNDTTKYSSGSFFLFLGSYNSGESVSPNVKMFAKVDGKYVLIQRHLNQIAIEINNSIENPYVYFLFEDQENWSNMEAIEYSGRWSNDRLVIVCPEKYLPEKLLPISL